MKLRATFVLCLVATLYGCGTPMVAPELAPAKPVYVDPVVYAPCSVPASKQIVTELDVLDYASGLTLALVECSARHQATVKVLREALNSPNTTPKEQP